MSESLKELRDKLAIEQCVVDDDGVIRQVGCFQPWFRKGFDSALAEIKKLEFPEAEVSNEAIDQMKLGVAVDSAYIRGARTYFNWMKGKLE